MTTTAPSPTVIYGNDVLCGWCFAIGPSILEAKRRLGPSVPWRLVSGGLVTGSRVRPIGEDRDYLLAGLANVAQVSGRVSGVAYAEKVLAPGTWVSNSEPASRAVLLAQELEPEVAIEFSHWLSDALYLDGRVPDDPDTLREAARVHGLDPDEFVAAWATPAALESTRLAWAQARAAGLTTYPTVFLDDGVGPWQPLTVGYADADTIETRVREALAATPSQAAVG